MVMNYTASWKMGEGRNNNKKKRLYVCPRLNKAGNRTHKENRRTEYEVNPQ